MKDIENYSNEHHVEPEMSLILSSYAESAQLSKEEASCLAMLFVLWHRSKDNILPMATSLFQKTQVKTFVSSIGNKCSSFGNKCFSFFNKPAKHKVKKNGLADALNRYTNLVAQQERDIADILGSLNTLMSDYQTEVNEKSKEITLLVGNDIEHKVSQSKSKNENLSSCSQRQELKTAIQDYPTLPDSDSKLTIIEVEVLIAARNDYHERIMQMVDNYLSEERQDLNVAVNGTVRFHQ